METFTTNEAGRLDLSRCFGLLPCQGRGALHTQYTAPLLPHLLPWAVTRAIHRIPLPYLGTGLFTQSPQLDMSLSASAGEEEGLGPYCQQQFAARPGFLPFPCPGLCSGSLRKPWASAFAFSCVSGLPSWPPIPFPSWLLPTLPAFPWNPQHAVPSSAPTLSEAAQAQPRAVPCHAGGAHGQGLGRAAASRKQLIERSWEIQVSLSKKQLGYWKKKCWFRMEFLSPVVHNLARM